MDVYYYYALHMTILSCNFLLKHIKNNKQNHKPHHTQRQQQRKITAYAWDLRQINRIIMLACVVYFWIFRTFFTSSNKFTAMQQRITRTETQSAFRWLQGGIRFPPQQISTSFGGDELSAGAFMLLCNVHWAWTWAPIRKYETTRATKKNHNRKMIITLSQLWLDSTISI